MRQRRPVSLPVLAFRKSSSRIFDPLQGIGDTRVCVCGRRRLRSRFNFKGVRPVRGLFFLYGLCTTSHLLKRRLRPNAAVPNSEAATANPALSGFCFESLRESGLSS